MWPFSLLSRARRRTPAHTSARECKPEWLDDNEFMAWLRATKPGEYNLVDGWDWRRDYLSSRFDSVASSLVKRCNWRWEGWLGCGTTTGLDKVPEEGPGHWWHDRAFIDWHDRNYDLEKWGYERKTAQSIAAEIIKFGAENPHCTPEQLNNLNYEALKGLKRRWQGWCGILQAVSGRIVCPECGSWNVDTVGTTAKCRGVNNESWEPKCENEWEPKWPKEK